MTTKPPRIQRPTAGETPAEREARLVRNRVYCKAYYQEHKPQYAERHRRWRAAHPERVAEQRAAAYERRVANGTARKHHLSHRYGITVEQERDLFARQGGRCAICRVELRPPGPGSRSTHLDHDRATGLVRGILCINCNHGLGSFADSPERMLAAIAYLREPPGII